MIVATIAALSKNRAIGKDGKLPWHLPEDMQHFRALTLGKPLIFGRTTYESIGRPLPGRQTIVLSRSPLAIAGCQTATSAEEALALAGGAPEVMIGGGTEIYELFMPRVTRQYLTEVDMVVDGDAFYPEFVQSEWREVERRAGQGCTFVTLERHI